MTQFKTKVPEWRCFVVCTWSKKMFLMVISFAWMHRTRHGPKPGCQEAEAKAFSILEAEAEAFTLFKLEAEAKALLMKPKPGYLYTGLSGNFRTDG